MQVSCLRSNVGAEHRSNADVYVLHVSQLYMACQSMLIVLVGFTPEYRVVQLDGVPASDQEPLQRVTFTEDIDSIVTEVN